MQHDNEPETDWRVVAVDYWLIWKPLVGIPGVLAWWATAGAVGLSPWQYLDHGVTQYDIGRRSYLREHPDAAVDGRYANR